MKKAQHERWRKSFPYYKVHFWNDTVGAWSPVQHLFNTEEEAQTHADSLGLKTRIMRKDRDLPEVAV